MNKTLNINLAGFSFTIEEDAYDSLQTYLEAIRSFLASEEDVDEIIADIERRIAELIQERLGDNREVVEQADVDHIMDVLGDPEYFQSEDPDLDAETQYEQRKKRRKARKIFRNPDNRVIGGVCGGLGSYFNIDPIVFRLAFVIGVLAFGVGFLPYIILWAVIPEAKTTAEKLEMEGEEVNVENIKNRFRKESQNVKDSFNNIKNGVKGGRKSEVAENIGSALNEILAFAVTLIKMIWVVLKKVLGVAAIILGAGFFIASMVTILVFFFGAKHDYFGQLGDLSNSEIVRIFFETPGDFSLMVLLGILFIVAFVASLFLAGFSALGFKLPSKTTLGITLPTVVIVSLIGFLTFLFSNLNFYENRGKVTEKVMLETFPSDTLHMHAKEDIYFSPDLTGHHNKHLEILSLRDDELISGRVMVDVEQSLDTNWYVVVEKYARAKTSREAREKAKGIRYQYQQQSNRVSFDPTFSWDKSLKYRSQEVRVTVMVPKGKTIYLADGTDRIIYDIDNVENVYDGRMIQKYWLMSEDGLTLAE